MLGSIERRTIEAQPVLMIRARASASTIGAMLGELFAEVGGYMERSGATMAGPPFVRYLTMGDDWDFEAGAPIATAVEGQGRIEGSTLPGGLVAVVTYTGPYEGVGEAHEAIGRWLAEQGRRPAGALGLLLDGPTGGARLVEVADGRVLPPRRLARRTLAG